MTPLTWCAYAGYDQAVTALLEGGADVNLVVRDEAGVSRLLPCTLHPAPCTLRLHLAPCRVASLPLTSHARLGSRAPSPLPFWRCSLPLWYLCTVRPVCTGCTTYFICLHAPAWSGNKGPPDTPTSPAGLILTFALVQRAGGKTWQALLAPHQSEPPSVDDWMRVPGVLLSAPQTLESSPDL